MPSRHSGSLLPIFERRAGLAPAVEDAHPVAALRQDPGRAEARRTRPEDRDARAPARRGPGGEKTAAAPAGVARANGLFLLWVETRA